MKVWVCTVVGENLIETLLGIFSTNTKARTQADIFMQGLGELAEEIDHEYANDKEVIYYQTVATQEKYTATLELYTVDEISF